MTKVALYTFGCKLNFSETSTIGEQFIKNGFEIVEFKEKADIYVLNTCTVTESAEKDCRQYVRKALRQNSNAFIIVMGCYAQLRPEEISNIEGVDLVLGSNEKFRLFSLIDSFDKKASPCVYVSPTEELTSFGSAHSTDADSRTRAFFKVQDGCDYKCSFCTIPLARGKSRSMPFENAIHDFNSLLNSNYKEIVLTGVNIGDYNLATGENFYSLLKEFVKIDREFRLRISSIESNLLTDEILELASSTNKICNHFHIPLQSGSQKILKLMQRRYNRDDYETLIHKIKKRIPDVGIGVDVITGFPGETKEDFEDTFNFLRDLPISYLHVFTYSERPNTKAINMDGSIDIHERRERTNRLRILSEKKRLAFYKDLINKDLDVLFEADYSKNFIKGFSNNYAKVSVPLDEKFINKIVRVNITGINDNSLSGRII